MASNFEGGENAETTSVHRAKPYMSTQAMEKIGQLMLPLWPGAWNAQEVADPVESSLQAEPPTEPQS